jgi:gliding motility-associated-like protein
MLFGNIKQYRLTIYNRWGQVIFQTTDPAKGWNGTYGGSQQDTNVFAWFCTYQFEGGKMESAKGTVVLIR